MTHLSAFSSGPVPSMVREPGGAPLHAHPSSRGTAVNSWPVSALAGLVCALLFLSSDGPGPLTYTGPSIAQLLAWISCSQRAPDLLLCHSLNLIFDYSFSATDDRKDVKAPLVENPTWRYTGDGPSLCQALTVSRWHSVEWVPYWWNSSLTILSATVTTTA